MHERGADRGEGMNKLGRSVWIGRGRGSSAVAIPSCYTFLEGTRQRKL